MKGYIDRDLCGGSVVCIRCKRLPSFTFTAPLPPPLITICAVCGSRKLAPPLQCLLLQPVSRSKTKICFACFFSAGRGQCLSTRWRGSSQRAAAHAALVFHSAGQPSELFAWRTKFVRSQFARDLESKRVLRADATLHMKGWIPERGAANTAHARPLPRATPKRRVISGQGCAIQIYVKFTPNSRQADNSWLSCHLHAAAAGSLAPSQPSRTRTSSSCAAGRRRSAGELRLPQT